MRGLRYAWAMAAFALCGMVATAGWAEVSTTGDTKDDGRSFYAGYGANGALAIDAGSVFRRSYGFLGYNAGSTGTAVITGAGSKWTNSSGLYVGEHGSGTLRVEAGGQVSSGVGTLGFPSGSTGTAIITGVGSTWTNSGDLYVGRDGSGKLTVSDGGLVSTRTLYASLGDLYGDGTITVQMGGILDADLPFDATHDLTQTMAFGSGGTLQFTVDGTSILGVGYKQSGSLRIAEGRSVASTEGYLGYNAGSTGTAVITGAGSKWTNSSDLYVGRDGSGTLRVEAGGQVSNTIGYLGRYSGSTGTAIITGAGSKWTISGGLDVGQGGSGTLRVEDGGQVSSGYGCLGGNSGSTGTAVITGVGSNWTNSDTLYVGISGTGTLRVEGGGQVSNGYGSLGYNAGSTGEAVVTGAGSKWANSGDLYVGRDGSGTLTVSDGGVVSAKTLWASLSDLYGDGSITVQGVVLDGDLSFDATHGLTQTRAFGSGGTLQFTIDNTSTLGVGHKRSGSLRIAEGRSVASSNGYLGYHSGSTGEAVIAGAGSAWTNSSDLQVGGTYGRGTLTVEDGGQVSSSSGYLGAYDGSTGKAIVTGAGSKWTSSGELYVGCGYGSNGTLRVEAGGEVSNTSGYLGYNASYNTTSMGRAMIAGAGSKWINSGELRVGYSGSGMLAVSDGGQVMAKSLGINSQSAVRLHVSGDRMLVVGDASTTGGISNDGKLSLLADAFLPAGTYRPIGEYADRSLSWTGSGSTLAAGGVWDSSARTFTVGESVRVDAGTAAEVASGMRLVISDPGSGERAGVSFGVLGAGTTLRGLPMTESERAALKTLLYSQEMILSGWDFAGELAGGEALVSFEVGLGEPGVRVWRLSQDGWKVYTPEMMAYDSKGIVSFTVDPASLNSGGYAVSTNPEPGGLGLLAVAAGMLLGRRRGRG